MLRVTQLHVRYGRLTAVRDISLRVAQGEIICIVGPNGAGKSTTLATIAGGVPAVSGVVELEGTSLLGKKPEAIARLGVSLVPEGRHVFSSLSVEENLKIGTFMRSGAATAADGIERIFTYFPRLRERSGQAAGKLSGGEQQMLVIGRALMTRPKLVLVDEPSLGLAPKIVESVYTILLELRRSEGLTLIVNEQSSERVMKFADRIYVLREGTIQLEGAPASFRGTDAVRRAYFGFSDGVSERTESAP